MVIVIIIMKKVMITMAMCIINGNVVSEKAIIMAMAYYEVMAVSSYV